MKSENQEKIKFSGTVLSVQPRSSVWRYKLDNRTHSTTGFNIFLCGYVENDNQEDKMFSVAISDKQQLKMRFRIGDKITGTAWSKKYPKLEYADYYRAGALKITEKADTQADTNPPPWTDEAPELAVYKERGCRMLDSRTWKNKCFRCKWACMANVIIEYDWGVSQKYRFESFCYGPKSCKLYKMGKPRAVPYKGSGTDYDEGWLDEILTDNRGFDE